MKRTTGLMMVGAMGLAMFVSTSAMAGDRDRGWAPSRFDDRGRFDNRNIRFDPRDHGRFDSRAPGRPVSHFDNRFDNRRVIVVNTPSRPMPAPAYRGPATTFKTVTPPACTTRGITTCTPTRGTTTGWSGTTVVRTTTVSTPSVSVSIIIR